MDSTLLGTFHPASGSYSDYSTPTFATTAGAHVVKFVGLNSLGGDHTAFIDNVRIQGSPIPGFGIEWLVTDQLGTPRMIFDKTGALANMKRHDYLPFGEELTVSQGLRTTLPGNTPLGYNTSDGVRQKFASKERDIETGLDYFSARYYGSALGRFTSIDPYNIVRESQITGQSNPEKAASQLARYLNNPQQWNRYAYTANNPLKYVDPSGQLIELTGDTEDERNAALERLKNLVGKEAGKHLGVRSEKGKDGKTHYYVTSDVNLCDVSGPKDSAKLNFYMSELIDRKDHTVEYKIADSFSTRVQQGVTTAGPNCGGACTVGAEESLTGNTQIFVNKNSDLRASEALHTPLYQGAFSGPDFKVTEDMVDAHEFGHAYANAIEGKSLYYSQATWARAVEWENLQRGTYTWPERRLKEKNE